MKLHKMIWLLSMCLLLVLISSCASLQKTAEQQDSLLLLENELVKWQTFKITGMADVQYQAFNIRRPIIIALSDNKFRLDIVDTGILGLGGGVLMAAYADNEKIQIRMPGNNQIETKDTSEEIGDLFSILLKDFFSKILEQSELIFQKGTCNINDFEIAFTHLMKLREINNSKQNLKIVFEYDRHGNLTDITVSAPMVRKLTIQVDKIEYQNIVVNPLR